MHQSMGFTGRFPVVAILLIWVVPAIAACSNPSASEPVSGNPIVFGATLPLFQGLRNGDVDVMLEIWLSNLPETWDAAIEAEEVVLVGKTLVGDWQSAFVIPAYLQKQYPDLDTRYSEPALIGCTTLQSEPYN